MPSMQKYSVFRKQNH